MFNVRMRWRFIIRPSVFFLESKYLFTHLEVNLPVLGRQLNRNGEKLHFLKRYNSRTDDRRELKGYIH